MAKKLKTMIGWKEWCALPALGLPAIRAKVDTGARTSALHAYDVVVVEKKAGRFVKFKIHPLVGENKIVRKCIAPLVENRVIVSSNGERENRPVIQTDVMVNGKKFNTEITLTSRHQMNFRMLLGRKALRKGRLTVDPAKSFLLGKIESPKKLYKKNARVEKRK